MVFRKPYAFLIKNFKKIHILMAIICAYIFYKHIQVYGLVREYVQLETYSSFLEPIGSYTNVLSYFAIIFIIIISASLLITLKRKNKPWKVYLIIIIEYLLMLFAWIMTTSFFTAYKSTTEIAGILATRDILFIASIPQYLVFIILLIRIAGIDLNKFDFAADKEFLELDSSDREEVEVNIEVDKDSIIRNIRKAKRNTEYFYKEHRFIVNTIGTIILVIFVGYMYYYFAILHKVYKEGQVFKASGYNIAIKNAYITDKNYRGDSIEGDTFVIVNMSVVNTANRRVMNVDRFHIVGVGTDVVSTNLYDEDFKDLGNPYKKRNFEFGKSYDFVLIFRIDKKYRNKKFNLYYQEYLDANVTYLRKIKLNLIDLSKIEKHNKYFLGKEMAIKVDGKEKNITFENMTISKNYTYHYYTCEVSYCTNKENSESIEGNSSVLKLDFSSLDFIGEDIRKLTEQNATITYKNKDNKFITINTVNPIRKKALDKSVYIVVPDEIIASGNVELKYVIRNNEYVVKLR